MEKPVVDGLIVEVDGSIAVLAVDEITAFEPVEIDSLPSVGDAVPAGLVRFALGELEYRGEPVVLLDITRLIAAIKIGTSRKGTRETGVGKIETNGKAVQGSVPSGSRE
jgi:chemotaxis signal transduction protein